MRLITDILREYRNGKLLDYATRKFQEAVRAVDETGKPATFNLKIKIKPSKDLEAEKNLSAGVDLKLPQPDIADAVFYSDSEGDLHRSDPSQNEMFKDELADRRATRQPPGTA
jgi:hypothetical protein